MNVADLFVTIGLKGVGGVKAGLESVSDGLKGVSSMSLEAKAGIAASIYGLEQLTQSSVQFGTDIKNAAMQTGVLEGSLQSLNRLASINGVSFDELANTLLHLKDIQSSVMAGGSIPNGLAPLGIDISKSPDEMLRQVWQNKNGLTKSMQRYFANQMGVSNGVLMMGTSGRQVPNTRMPELSHDETEKLDTLRQQWADFWVMFKTSFGSAVATMAPEIGSLVDGLKDLTLHFHDLAELLHVTFGHYGTEELKNYKGPALTPYVPSPGHIPQAPKSFKDHLKDALIGTGTPMRGFFDQLMKPTVGTPNPKPTNAKQMEVNLTQNISVNGTQDPQAVVDEIQDRALRNAIFQNPALLGGD